MNSLTDSASDTRRSATSVTRAVADHYRCRPEFINFDVAQYLSDFSGFFSFGPDIVCFGRCDGGLSQHLDGALPDVAFAVSFNGNSICLPFDCSEVVENLRREKYVSAYSENCLFQRALSRAYYLARPMLGVRARKYLQRWRLRNWKALPFPRWPVDHNVEDFLDELLRLALKTNGVTSIPFVWFWPDGASAAAVVTHDVETESGRDFCTALMDIDDEFHIKSSFQVVPEQRYDVPPAYIDGIRSRGFEVNIHDLNHDGNLFRDHSEFLRRAGRINAYARRFDAHGFRSAVLYRNLDWLQALNFSYDMSVPNVAHLDPQRGGCCTVMPYFLGDMLELPVTLTQDYALFHFLNDYSTRLWDEQIDIILAKHGLINVIVHPDYMTDDRQARNVYLTLLHLLARLRSEQTLWIARPDEINHWWRQRRCMSVVRKGNRWVVEGPNKQRARVAYARLERDRVVYSLSN